MVMLSSPADLYGLAEVAQVHGNSSAQEARRSTTLEEENVLWKEVMDFLHDAGEEELKKKRRKKKRRNKKQTLQSNLHLLFLTPAAGAHTGLTDEELAGLDATSVELLPDAEREVAPAAKSAAAPKSFSGALDYPNAFL